VRIFLLFNWFVIANRPAIGSDQQKERNIFRTSFFSFFFTFKKEVFIRYTIVIIWLHKCTNTTLSAINRSSVILLNKICFHKIKKTTSWSDSFKQWFPSFAGIATQFKSELIQVFCCLRKRVARWYVFKLKIQIWINFGGPWNENVRIFYVQLDYITAIWYILWHFGNLVATLYTFPYIK
jgi:hypothetical protein